VAKIDEVHGRWTRAPEEEALDLDAFLPHIMRLPKAAQPLQRLPNFSQTTDILDRLALEKPCNFKECFPISRSFSDEYAPAGNRTRT
jgi:hypothetical protein